MFTTFFANYIKCKNNIYDQSIKWAIRRYMMKCRNPILWPHSNKITAELHHPAHLERRLSEFTHSYADTWSYLTTPLSFPNKQEDKIEFLK